MPDPTQEELLARAEARSQAGDADGALRLLDALLQQAPRHAAARVNRAAIRAGMGEVQGAIVDLDVAIQVDARLWPALMNRSMLRMAQASAIEKSETPSLASTAWAFAAADAGQVADLRPDLPFGHVARGLALAALAARLGGQGEQARADALRREALDALERGAGLPGASDFEHERTTAALRELRACLSQPPAEETCSDQKARAEYIRIGLLSGLLPVQRACDWYDNEFGVPEGSEPTTTLAIVSAENARQRLAARLSGVPGRCTRGIAGRAWLGTLALGFDRGDTSAGDLAQALRVLYEPGFLSIDEAPHLNSVLREVETGRSAIEALRQALEPFTFIARRFAETGQLES